MLVLATDPTVIAAAMAATRKLRGLAAHVTPSGADALARLAAPGHGYGHLLADPDAAGAAWPHLLATVTDPSTSTALVVVSSSPARVPEGMRAVPPAAGPLMAAMSRQPTAAPSLAFPKGGAAALQDGLSRGEIVVRYQPVVRLRDRRPVMVEALARWQRKPHAIGPDTFVPMAQQYGLVRALSIAVASTTAEELGRLHAQLGIGVSLNLPLNLLLQPDLTIWLAGVLAGTGLRPAQLALELTETLRVDDTTLLRRSLVRLRRAGYRVLLDDIVLDDERTRFFALPFAGFKLDRSLVVSLPEDGRARNVVRRLVAAAHARGQIVVAEGVSDPRYWAAVRALGVDAAQGFVVGRPLPAEALRAWWSSWRGRRPG